MFKLAFLFTLCIYSLNAQIPIPQTGSCVASPVLADFDVSKVRKSYNYFEYIVF
jgi:hypothetical protein